MRTASVIVAAAAVLFLAACTEPQREGGEAVPAGSAPAAPSSAVPASPSAPASRTPPATASPTTSPPATKDPNVLGPTGFGALKLGMTREQAIATGLVDTFPAGEGCASTRLKAAPKGEGHVTYNSERGVVAIDAYNSAMHTPEGIHVGSSRDDLLLKYPEWQEAGAVMLDGRGYANVRGNEGAATYRIVTEKGKVTELTLQDRRQGCYE
jgi:hypothetical protein